MQFDLIEKARTSYLVFQDGAFWGEIEQVRDDWVFHPRAGLPGTRYAFGCNPLDALQQWMARNKGELKIDAEQWPI